jgi:protein arginine N-methyltransferase 5
MNECTELVYQSVIFVAGAGRGPLVDRAITASEGLSKSVEIYAIEKNSNAVVG